MILIGHEIIERLKAATFPIPVTVRDFYSPDEVKVPLITVDEHPSNEGVYLDNQPSIVTNILTVEVYAKAASINGAVQNQKAVALSIMLAADQELTRYGLTMTGQVAIAPYTDTSICRAVARYVAYIDTRRETENILRRL